MTAGRGSSWSRDPELRSKQVEKINEWKKKKKTADESSYFNLYDLSYN